MLLLPPVMRKYDTMTAAYTVMAEGMCSHDGFFSLMLGHSSTAKGKLYRVSIFGPTDRAEQLTSTSGFVDDVNRK